MYCFIIVHFYTLAQNIYTIFNNAQFNYNIGVYGSRNVCSQVIDSDYAILAFVDGASTGYSGNMGFNMPEKWAFNQIKEGITVEGIQVDNDQVSGKDSGVGILIKEGQVLAKNTNGNNSNGESDLTELKNFTEKASAFLMENFLNIKYQNRTGGINGKFSWNNWNKYFPTEYFFDKLVYLRTEVGVKAQAFQGGFITIYLTKDKEGIGSSVDVLPFGIGVNVTPLLDNKITMNLIKDLIEVFDSSLASSIYTASGGVNLTHSLTSIQVYPKWVPDLGTEAGYYEFGAELGFTLTEEMILALAKKIGVQLTENSILEMTNGYFYVDLIVGVSDDLMLAFGGDLASIAAVIIIMKLLEAFKNKSFKFNVEGKLQPTNSQAEELLQNLQNTQGLGQISEEPEVFYVY